LTQSETVTLFNDMCLLAPATLIHPGIAWQTIDGRTVQARFTNAGHTIDALLSFGDAGELINFVSDDRYQTAPDGLTLRRLRWSTPIQSYRAFGAVRLLSEGAGRWHADEGNYSYIELAIDDVQCNVQPLEMN
jgi:hypothetical protein